MKGLSKLSGKISKNVRVELTYRCNLKCLHCYCNYPQKNSFQKELTTKEWKKIIDKLYDKGYINITFTGGEPLLRDDFLTLYKYAKRKGFLITVFTNATLLNSKILSCFSKYLPFAVEVTINGATKETYESISCVKGSFEKAQQAIEKLKKENIPVILKANCLKQNKDEIIKIKNYAKKVLGRSKKGWNFKYDSMIYPRLNGDCTPCQYRLSFEELLSLRQEDADIWNDYRETVKDLPEKMRYDRQCMYHCNSWQSNVLINPYGRLKFCEFSEKFSSDLREVSLEEAQKKFDAVEKEKFKTNSKCINCKLRHICYYCPARAFLETGDEEAPVEYFCHMAKNTYQLIKELKKTGNNNVY